MGRCVSSSLPPFESVTHNVAGKLAARCIMHGHKVEMSRAPGDAESAMQISREMLRSVVAAVSRIFLFYT